MKSIIFIMRTMEGGGAEKVLINILNNIDYSQYNVNLLVVNKLGVYLNTINKNVNVKYIYNPEKYKNKILQSIYYRLSMFFYYKTPKLVHILKIGNRYDVEIGFLEGEATKLVANSCNKKSKKVSWIHTDIKSFDEKRISLENLYYKKIDEIICVSNGAASSFRKIYPHYYNKVRIIYNLIDKNDILRKASEDISFKVEGFSVIAIGRLVKEKRIDLLIKAVKLLLEEDIYVNLLILGAGEKELELRELIKKYNINDNVRMLGFIDNPYPYLKNADLFALSSDIEGLPLVLCEAMILGKAIVATNCTGPKELLNDGEFGIITNCNNEVDLKNAIKSVISSKALKNSLEEKSKMRSDIFNSNFVMKQIVELFES